MAFRTATYFEYGKMYEIIPKTILASMFVVLNKCIKGLKISKKYLNYNGKKKKISWQVWYKSQFYMAFHSFTVNPAIQHKIIC